jgi:co-chaperonin GroES (HSP10)
MNETTIQPLGTKIYAAEMKKERRTESGLILDSASSVKETAQAVVLAIGDEVKLVSVNDNVYLDWSKTKLVIVDGHHRVIVDEEDVMAIVK